MNDSGTVRGERAIHTQTIERFWSIFHKYIPELPFVTIKGKTLTFSARRLMLIWRTAVLALGLCLALIGDSLAQSKWPSPPPRPEPSQQEQSHPGGDQQSPAPNQQAAPQLPPIINIMPAPKTEAEAAEERRERGLKAELDRKLVDLTGELAEFTRGLFIATVILAVATIGLLIATAGLAYFAYRQSRDMKASIAVSGAAAKAAQKSAEVAEKSLFEANRPFIVISPLELCEANAFQASPHIHFGLRNSGKGVAIVNKVGVTVQTTPSIGGALTLATNSEFVDSDGNGAIEPGQTMRGYRIASDVLGVRELQQIKSAEMTLGIIFEIVANDIFHNPYNQILPLVFDHRQRIFTRSSLVPEKK